MTDERRFEAIRAEALRHGTVDASGVRPAGAPFPQATSETGYYGLPLLKPPTWTWEVPVYFFIGGAAGASALIGSIAGDPILARDAKWIAAVGGGASGALLTADLGRPERFVNMLRVFKLQSPMSVGAWTLAAFSTASAAAAFSDVVKRRTAGRVPTEIVADASAALAAGTGLVMTTYTGVLIGATAIPAWNRHVRVLPIHFAASALGSAASLLELFGHNDRALHRLAMLAAAVETATGVIVEADRDRASAPLKTGRSGWVTRVGGVLSGPVPLAMRLAGHRARRTRRAAAIITVAGAILTRFGWWAAGSASADDPRVPLRLEPVESARGIEASDDHRPDVDRRPAVRPIVK